MTGSASATAGRPDFSARREQNLLLIAQPHVRWPWSDELKGALRELRTAYPAGSATMNFVASREGTDMRASFMRIGSAFLISASGKDRSQTDLGTVHLFEPVGWRTIPMRLYFRVIERRGGDFPKHGHKIVRNVEDAADWLAVSLASGPVQWSRGALRDTIASFIRDNPLT